MRNLVLVLFLFFIFSFYSQGSFAQENGTSESAVLSSLDYELPYPGLLPDSPLYFLKPLRDTVVNFLISDPLKKAEFKLLLADKRLSAGVALFAQKREKISLAVSTVSKGENYFEDAIDYAQKAKKEGRDTAEIMQKLSLSAEKHEVVLKDLESRSLEQDEKNFTKLIIRVNDFKKRLVH